MRIALRPLPCADGTCRCDQCGKTAPQPKRGYVLHACDSQPAFGPGTELKAILAKFGITSTPTCGCNKMAKQMDAWGPEECLNHIEEIVDVMGAEAQKRQLPFIRTAGRLLVRKAIRNAKRKATGK